MSLPRFPLRDRLRDPVDDAALGRIWEGIDARFPRRHRGRPAVFRLGFALTALGAAGMLFWLYPRHDRGPLRLSSGMPLVSIDAPADGASMSLSDGSRIDLAAGARLQPLEASDSSFVAVLERGTAAFDVRPGRAAKMADRVRAGDGRRGGNAVFVRAEPGAVARRRPAREPSWSPASASPIASGGWWLERPCRSVKAPAAPPPAAAPDDDRAG